MIGSRTLPRLALGALGLGAGLVLLEACGVAGGSSPGRTFDHATFFVVTGSHQGLACEACHDPKAPSFSFAGGGVDCLGCHVSADVTPMHGGLAGYAWSCDACIRCHKDGKTPVFDHGFFPIGSGAVHQGLACASCHGPTKAVADLQCTTCHAHDQPTTDARHAGVAGYQYASPSCYGCHQNGAAARLPANHDTALFPVTGTAHAAVGCAQCHGATKAVADLGCTSCHGQADMAAAHAAIPASTTGRVSGATRTSYQWTSTACVSCHADGQVDRIAAHPAFSHGLNGNGHGPFCLSCHQASRTDKAWAADFKTFSCLDCHLDNAGNGP